MIIPACRRNATSQCIHLGDFEIQGSGPTTHMSKTLCKAQLCFNSSASPYESQFGNNRVDAVTLPLRAELYLPALDRQSPCRSDAHRDMTQYPPAVFFVFDVPA